MRKWPSTIPYDLRCKLESLWEYRSPPTVTATDNQPLMAPKPFEAIRMLTTTAIPTDGGAGSDESTIFMGNFNHLLIGIRSDIRIEVLKER